MIKIDWDMLVILAPGFRIQPDIKFLKPTKDLKQFIDGMEKESWRRYRIEQNIFNDSMERAYYGTSK